LAKLVLVDSLGVLLKNEVPDIETAINDAIETAVVHMLKKFPLASHPRDLESNQMISLQAALSRVS